MNDIIYSSTVTVAAKGETARGQLLPEPSRSGSHHPILELAYGTPLADFADGVCAPLRLASPRDGFALGPSTRHIQRRIVCAWSGESDPFRLYIVLHDERSRIFSRSVLASGHPPLKPNLFDVFRGFQPPRPFPLHPDRNFLHPGAKNPPNAFF